MSTTLSETLLDPARRDHAVTTLVNVVEAEVASKGGLSGVALKTGFKAVQKMSPDLVRRAVNGMLPDFATSLQPYWEARGESPFGAYLASHGSVVADSLLSVSDERAQRPNHAAVAKIYNGLRPKAKAQVEEALPRLGTAIESLAG